jgi:hypothetical protein
MSYQLGGTEFTTADALTIALACVAVIVSFFAIAKGCEKFMQTRKEGMALTAVTPSFQLATVPGGVTGSDRAGISQNQRQGANLGDATVELNSRWVAPKKEHMNVQSKFDKLKSYVKGLKEHFVLTTDASQQNRNADFVKQSQRREHMETCVGTGMPLRPGQTQKNCEGYTSGPTIPPHSSVAKVNVWPDGYQHSERLTVYGPNGAPLREHMNHSCEIQPDGTCREHMKGGGKWINARSQPTAIAAEAVHEHPFLSGSVGVVREHYDGNGYVQTVDDVAYQCSPMNATVPPTPAGGTLSYLRIVPQDAEQALGAELPFDTNSLNQAELTNTDAYNVDVGQLLLKFGPDEITADNVAMTGEDGFIARELKYRKKPVVLTDGVNTYTFNTYEEWANFQYNPVNSGATAEMGVGNDTENFLSSWIPNVRSQGATYASPNEYMSNRIGMVSTARSRIASKNFV